MENCWTIRRDKLPQACSIGLDVLEEKKLSTDMEVIRPSD